MQMIVRTLVDEPIISVVPTGVDVPAVRWYRSFYFRIGFSFVAFAVCLLGLQTLLFTLAGRAAPLRNRPPNTVVAIVAADLGAALTQNADVDLDDYLKKEYAQSQPIYVVRKNGTVASNRSEPLAADLQLYVDTMLRGGPLDPASAEPRVPIPFVTAPLQINGALAGIVVLPPAARNPLSRDLDRLASLPGTALLVVLTIVAAAFIFEPSRRRLKALEEASVRLGGGDLTARAQVTGGDEVASVAAAFNTMAAELASRDEALRTSNRLRRQMLADVSHELKTPLTSMRAYVETLRTREISLDDDTRERYFATLERETIRLDRLVNDLIDLSRLENGVTDLQCRVFAIRRVFEHVVHRHQPEIEQRGISVQVDVEPDADQIVGDPHRLEQVIENVFANALRHTTAQGRIGLEARLHGRTAMLSVTDSGVGIASEHLPHVFDRFYKVDSARANVSGGSGLGLSIVKTIVERHGGHVSVTSRPGETRFTVAVPQDRAATADQSPASTNL